MAAYAALVTLMNTLLNIEDHHRFSNSLDKKQVESLREKLDFLLDFIESTGTTHDSQSDEAQLALERKIAAAAFAAEHVIESHIVRQIDASSKKLFVSTKSHIVQQISAAFYRCISPLNQICSGSISLLNLQTVIQNMDSIQEKVATAEEQRGFKDHVQQPTHPTSSSTSSSKPKSRMVGLDDELIRLLDELTGNQSTLKIIPIDGMGGIGKTTLARNVYEHALIVQHFDVRAWATISQQYTATHIFAKLLSCIYSDGEFDRETETQLEERLYKSLIGRRYLIILDDIWSLEAWHTIRRFFPNNDNRSRVVVTTRLSTIANHFSTSPFRLGFLDEETSWELFCENASPGEVACPHELEEIGKKIVKKCKGLPLLIVVIGALLGKSSSLEYWEKISENIQSILSSREEESLDILSLSYNHLPAHLKPCFLYMATFPEDNLINMSQLIKVWVAEGFVRPSKTQTLEEVAEGYLKDLTDRNLISVRRYWFTEEIEWGNIHDLLRDLLLEKARKENFLCVMRVGNIRQGIDTESCFVFNQGSVWKPRFLPGFLPEELNIVESAFLGRGNGDSMSNKFKMLRILSAPNSLYDEDYMLKQVNLRCISIFGRLPHKKKYTHLPSSISLLWNLQTLTIHGERIVAPCEIWEMPQLRHVNVTKTIWLPDPPPPPQAQDDDFVVMRNLQTLGIVLNLTEEACKRLPNVKRLKLLYNSSSSSYDFGRLHKLESLECIFDKEKQSPLRRVGLLENLTFPSSLQELCLQYCGLHWEDLTMIGSLPHLQILQLKEKSVIGSEWNPVEGGYLCLRVLDLYICYDLINWNADNSHFPLLEKLRLTGLANLNEIPSGLGEIPTLAVVYLFECSESSSISAVKILDEQESFGNERLRVQIRFGERDKVERFKEKIEQFESSTSNNLELSSLR